jgi:hypothetical protein
VSEGLGRGGKRAAGRGGKKVSWADGVLGPGWILGFLILSISISFTTNSTNLNSNKFEFKTLFTQTNKIMHQHECNNKIIPMINFNYLWNKN